MDRNKVLIVDDNMNNIQVLAGILENNGYELEFALNGQDALQWLKEEKFDIILLDIMMPVMDGFEICLKIRNDERTKEIPVIFLTAKTDKESLMRGFKCGGNDYISKPYDQGELLARINTHLELKRNRDELKQLNAHLEEKVAERTRELEKALKKVQQMNEELQELDNAKSEFLRIISHEIRTPLNGIMGFSEILASSVKDNHLSEYIDLLEVSVKRLERFALNALMITTLRLNKKLPKFGIISPDKIINKIIDELGFLAHKVGTELICPPEITLYADMELFSMCLSNLLSNALNFSPAGGVVRIEVKKTPTGIAISVSDQGPGFNDEALKNLFGYFAKGEKHVDGNEGLGLALCRQIMLFHQGTIEVKNLPERGAEVTIEFPQKPLDNFQ